MARKADLRPSPITSTLSSDLLTLTSSFHVNYLPDILSTFKGLFSDKSNTGLGLKEFDIESVIKPAVLLDGQLAHEQDSRLSLIEAANRVAFRRNNLYFPSPVEITPESLETFHQQTLERTRNGSGYSLLLSVNDSKVIGASEFQDVIKSTGMPLKTSLSSDEESSVNFNEGKEFRIETINPNSSNDFLLTFPVKLGGFNQKNSIVSSIFDALLKKHFPTCFVSITSDTALLGIHQRFPCDRSASEIKAKLQELIKAITSLPDMVKDEELTWAKERSRFNRSMAIDSRHNRLLTFAHRFAFTGKLPDQQEVNFNNEELRSLLKESLQGVKPVLISKGNYKKLPFYSELF